MAISSKRVVAGLSAFVFCVCASMAGAAPVAYYSTSGVGSMGNVNAETWGGVNYSQQSVAFEVTIDFTQTVDDETTKRAIEPMVGRPVAAMLRGITGANACTKPFPVSEKRRKKEDRVLMRINRVEIRLE